jgi:hypothetical protein
VGVPSYRICFLNSGDHIASADVIECDTDGQAQARASLLVHYCGYPGIEVWERDRIVCRVRKANGRKSNVSLG